MLRSARLSLGGLTATMAGMSALAGVIAVWGTLTLFGPERGEARGTREAAHASQTFATAVDRALYDVVQDLRTMAVALSRPSFRLEADDPQPTLRAWLDLRADYADLTLAGANGRVTAAGDETALGREVSGRPWFLRARATRSVVVILSAETGGAAHVEVALPIPGPAAGREDILVARLGEAWLSGIKGDVLRAVRGTGQAVELSLIGSDGRAVSAAARDHRGTTAETVERATASAGYRDLAPSGWLAVARPQNRGAGAIGVTLPDGKHAVLWLAVCLLAAGAGWCLTGRIARRLRRLGGETIPSSPSRIADLRACESRLIARERSGARALHEARTALARIRERLRTFEAMSGWTYWEIDTESGNVTWADPAARPDVAAADRATALADLTDGIDPEDRDLMAFTMQAALDGNGPHDVVLRTAGPLAQSGQRRLMVRFIRREEDVPAGTSTRLHALSREVVGEGVTDGRDRPRGPAAREEQRTDLVLRQVVDGVIHDFNNVLTVVTASLGTLKRRHPLEADQTRLVDAALAGAQRGSSLTRRLINFVRREEASLQETDVAAAIAAFVPFLGSNVLHQTSIETRVRPGLPKVLCSEQVIEAILLNLAFHVRDLGCEGFGIGADEEVLSGQDGMWLPAGGYVRIVLISGTPARIRAGMQPAHRDPTRAVASLLTQVGGGFRLVADGSGDGGFLAEMWLPAGRSACAGPASETGAAAQPRALRVLLVDSDTLVRESFAEALSDLGHTVVQAVSAAHALSLLDDPAGYDAMVADQAMPVMSGLQLAVAVAERHPDIRVVLTSPHGQLPQSARAFLRIDKPFRYADLAAVMRDAAGNRAAEAA